MQQQRGRLRSTATWPLESSPRSLHLMSPRLTWSTDTAHRGPRVAEPRTNLTCSASILGCLLGHGASIHNSPRSGTSV